MEQQLDDEMQDDIVGPSVVELEAPQMDMGVQPSSHFDNLAETLDEDTLGKIASFVQEGFDADVGTLDDWKEMLAKGTVLLGTKLDKSSTPFEGACAAVAPLLIENIVKFQGKAIQELFPPGGPVRTQVVGLKTDEVELQAQRVREFMNYQLTEQIPDYFDEMEKLLFHLAYAGVAFKKIYWDYETNRPCVEFVRGEDLVVNAFAPSLVKAERYTHIIIKNEVQLRRDINSGLYRDVELSGGSQVDISRFRKAMNSAIGKDETVDGPTVPYVLLEQHVYTDLVDGEFAPFIITIEKDSRKVLAIRRNWDENDPSMTKLEYFVKYGFVPSDNFYSFGYVHLLGQLTLVASDGIRSLVDAGQFGNLRGGFKAKGLKVIGDNTPLKQGEYRDIELAGNSKIADVLMPINYPEPSQTLFQLVQFIVGMGQKFADSTESVVADSTNYGPVGTTLALLEQSTRFFNSIHKRCHKALRDEFRILKRLNARELGSEYPYDVNGGDRKVKAVDFNDKVAILPVSDPNIATQSQRAAKAQAVAQLAMQAPQFHNVREAFKQVYVTMGIDEVDRILPPPQQPQPQDPLSDIQAATQGLPIKAFMGQDHDAHVAVKSAWAQDPLQGGNPAMAQINPVILANIREHMIMKYQEQMNGLMKQMQGQVPEDKIYAEAAAKILETNQMLAENAAEKSAGATLLDYKELELAKEKLEHTKIKDAATIATRNREIALREKEAESRSYIEGVKLDAKRKSEAKKLAAQMAMKATDKLVDSIEGEIDREHDMKKTSMMKRDRDGNDKQRT